MLCRCWLERPPFELSVHLCSAAVGRPTGIHDNREFLCPRWKRKERTNLKSYARHAAVEVVFKRSHYMFNRHSAPLVNSVLFFEGTVKDHLTPSVLPLPSLLFSLSLSLSVVWSRTWLKVSLQERFLSTRSSKGCKCVSLHLQTHSHTHSLHAHKLVLTCSDINSH